MPFPERIEPASQVVKWLSDDFASLDTDVWEVVSGNPTPVNSELTIPSGTALLSKQGFEPPCLVEVVTCMTARATGDDFRLGFYTDDNNYVEWRAAGTNPNNMDALMQAGGVADNQTNIYVNAGNNSYRLASIYVGVGEALWAYRYPNSQTVRNEVYRIREYGIPRGPFRVRLAGLAGSSSLKVHSVRAYQLADIIVPGAQGHAVDNMAIPVRLTNTPFIASPSNTGLNTVQVSTDTFSALAAGSVGTGSNKYGYMEQVHVQVYYSGDQPFTCWLEAQMDATNWVTIWYGTATDATTDAVTRYFAASPILQSHGGRNHRVKVKNTGAAAGNFRTSIVFTVL